MSDSRFWSQQRCLLVAATILILSFLSLCSALSDTSVSCYIPSVEPMANTSLTCHFPEDVRLLKKNFFVTKINWTDLKDEKDILDCWWMKEQMSCEVFPGYKYSRMISHELTLEIPRVSAEQIGTYICTLSNMNQKDIRPCDLKIKLDGRTMCDIPSVKVASQTSLTCYFPENINETKNNFYVLHYSKRGFKDDVLSCEWTGGAMNCIIGIGYIFDLRVTDHLTVGIPMAVEEDEGIYSCHINGLLYQNCSLTLEKVKRPMCEIPSVKEMSPTALTCYFPQDLNKTRQHFAIFHNSSYGTIVPVISCEWEGYKLNCTPCSHGYEFDQNVTDQVILRISSASENHEGTYSCQVKGQEAKGSDSCSFLLDKATYSSCNISSEETYPTILTCNISVDVNVSRWHFKVLRLSGESNKGTPVVICLWLEDELACTKAQGYEFNSTITDKLVMTVPHSEHNATYVLSLLRNKQTIIVTQVSEVCKVPDWCIAIGSLWILVPVIVALFTCLKFKPWKYRWESATADERKNLLEMRKKTLTTQAQAFWGQWVQAAFPDLEFAVCFMPSGCYDDALTPWDKEPKPISRQSMFGQDVLMNSGPGLVGWFKKLFWRIRVLARATSKDTSSHVKRDATMQRLLYCLETMYKERKESVVGISQLQFGKFLGEPCLAAAADQTALLARLPPARPLNWKHGDFDILFIHRNKGVVICEVKSFGDNVEQNTDKNIRKTLEEAISSLKRAKAMLLPLVSEIASGLRITKTIAVPNLKVHQVQDAISGDTQLTKDLHQCLGHSNTNIANILDIFLCSDHLSDVRKPLDISNEVLKKLCNWWERLTAESGSEITSDQFQLLVARLCGPVTTMTIPCISPPRLGQVVPLANGCYTAQISLFPEQINLLNTAPSRLFLDGPPGTGKTVVLLLMGIEWLKCGSHVNIVSTCTKSRAACSMLYHLLQQTINIHLKPAVSTGQVHLRQYDLNNKDDMEKAVTVLSQEARGRSLYVIADEVDLESQFPNFCVSLLARDGHLHLWAASCYKGLTPAGWERKCLTRPLRSPPAVVEKVKPLYITDAPIEAYSARNVVHIANNPQVKLLNHGGQGRSGDWPGDCVQCAKNVAEFLKEVGVPQGNCTARSFTHLEWRDVLVVHRHTVTEISPIVTVLNNEGFKMMLMNHNDVDVVATACSDEVWVASADDVCGMERKVVVCLMKSGDRDGLRPFGICSSHLVIVSH